MQMRRIQYERFLLPALVLSAACHLLAALVPSGAVDFLFRREIQQARTVRFEVVELQEEPLRVLETRENNRPRVLREMITGSPPLPPPRQSVNWQLTAAAPDLSRFIKPGDMPLPPAQPAIQVAVNTDSIASMESYISQVLNRIEKARRYPESARRMGRQGAVEVAFTIERDGEIIKPAHPVESSPYNSLNRAACSSIKHSAPFPSLPPCISSDKLPLVVTIKFELQ